MKILCFVVATLLYAAGVMAQTAGQTGSADLERRFRQADRDGDGKLSPAEARQAAWLVDEVQRFDSIDRDHSGTVTLAEILATISEQVSSWMDADEDKDGRVTEAEAKKRGGLGDSFNRADANADGVVTRAEFEDLSQRTYYRDAELPSVAPNIIEKRF